MKSSADLLDDKFKTYPVRSGWITVVGDFDDVDVLRALYLAQSLRDNRRVARSIVETISRCHADRSRLAIQRAPPGDHCVAGPEEQIAALELRYADLQNESQHLERLFAACGYPSIIWEGRIGQHLLPFAGRGLETAVEIVATVLDGETAAATAPSVEGATEVEVLRQLADRLQMRRASIDEATELSGAPQFRFVLDANASSKHK